MLPTSVTARDVDGGGGCVVGWTSPMIPLPTGVRVWLATRLLEQMELQLEELEATATEDELAAEQVVARSQAVQSFQRKRPSRKPFPDHLPRERVVIPAPANCPCCGSDRLSKLGEDITETLEVVPRQWKGIQAARAELSCRACRTTAQP